MTTYNTGNALGSVDVRDLYDNAENLDNFENGPLNFYADRLGVSRQSLQGIRNASQYQIIGAYGAGLNFTSYNQVFSYLGEFYAPSAGLTLPYTTTGAGAGEVASFRSVGDAILRSDLAASSGAALVGVDLAESYPDNTVGSYLSALASSHFNVKTYGASGDGVTDDTAFIALAVAAAKLAGGGSIYFPPGRYKVSTADDNLACIFIDFDNARIFGDGLNSEIFTTSNSHIPIHVSSQADVSTPVSVGAVINGFVCENMTIRGTGVYQNYSLAKGRGILVRRAKDVIIRNNFVFDMSMIGICTEHGQGFFSILNNTVKDCRYTAINYNGRAYNSLVQGNICSGSNADVNAVSIQVDGPCIVQGNTIYGNVTDYANCGGILWGEGGYDGIGSISGNLITHCRFGVKAIFHGSCTISNNVIINCRTTGGINAIGSTSGGFTVASSHNIISANLLINCSPNQIDCSAANSLITNNIIRNIVSPTLPSASSEPDAIFSVTVEAGVRVRAEGCSILGNMVDGATRGIITTIGFADGAISGNTTVNVSASYSLEGDSGKYITIAQRERRHIGGNAYIDNVSSGAVPSTGYYEAGSTWRPSAYTIGQPLGAVALQSRIDEVATTAAAGATTVVIVGAANFVAGTNSKVGFKLDNGDYHWSTISASSVNTLTITSAIPAGRSAPASNPVYVDVWRLEANLT